MRGTMMRCLALVSLAVAPVHARDIAASQCSCTGVNTGINTTYYGTAYGKTCATHDKNMDYCQSNGKYKNAAWCTQSWCYVSAACYNEQTKTSPSNKGRVFEHVFHSTASSKLYYSYDECYNKAAKNEAGYSCSGNKDCKTKGFYCHPSASICLETGTGKIANYSAGQKGNEGCPKGSYQPNLAGYDCYFCPLGHISTSLGATQCKKTLPGYAPNSIRTAAEGCKAGSYSDRSGSARCLQCTGFNYSGSVTANSQCKCANPGYVPNSGNTGVQQCEKGEFMNVTCGVKCHACDAGQYAKVKGAQKCICANKGHVPFANKTEVYGCGPGTHMPNTCGTACKNCDSGKYSNGSINSDCTCASHGYVADLANGKGATVQRGCVAGSYMNETCGKACRTCESGKYSNDSKVNRACKCADTGHRVTKGLRSQTGCVAGSYSNVTCASVCSSCESGKVSTGAKNVKCNCTHPGYTPNLGKTAQVGCGKGYYSDSWCSTSCSQCGVGKYAGQPTAGGGNSKCDCAALGHAPSAGRDAQLPCGPGLYAPKNCSEKCLVCGGGRFAEHKSNSNCSCAPRGHHPNANRSAKVACAVGSHAAEECSEGCAQCPAGRTHGFFKQDTSTCNGLSLNKKVEPHCRACTDKVKTGCITWTARTGSISCAECGTGSASATPGYTKYQCPYCAVGKYADELGLKQCKECPRGQFGVAEGNTNCTPCVTGRYQDEVGKSECKLCNSGTVIAVTGAMECEACGFFNYSQGINSDGEGGAECSKCMDPTIVFGMGAPGFSPANPHQCSITLSILSGLACFIFCPIICRFCGWYKKTCCGGDDDKKKKKKKGKGSSKAAKHRMHKHRHDSSSSSSSSESSDDEESNRKSRKHKHKHRHHDGEEEEVIQAVHVDDVNVGVGSKGKGKGKGEGKPLWKQVLDEETGKTYYYNRKTKEVSWTEPKASC